MSSILLFLVTNILTYKSMILFSIQSTMQSSKTKLKKAKQASAPVYFLLFTFIKGLIWCKPIGDLVYRIQSLRFIFIIFQTLHVDVKSWQETRSRNILVKTPQKLTFVRDQIFIFTVVNSGTWRVWSQERRQFLHFGPASQYKTNYFY